MRGDFSALARFRNTLKRIGDQSARTELTREIAREVKRLALDGFASQQDAYGNRWEPRKDKRGTWPVLDKTGRAKRSIEAVSEGARVVLSGVGYLNYHQTGTVRMVPRQVAPEPSRGLGIRWASGINAACRTVLSELLEARRARRAA